MNIGILYICTGKYDRFFKDFYKSCEENFLPGHKKTYYVWTDSEDSSFEEPNVVKFYQQKLGWPYDTMMRFSLFAEKKSIIDKEDYLFFLNANMIIEKVGDEILPDNSHDLVAVLHPGFYFNTNTDQFPYERSVKSRFCIPYGMGSYYFQGCFNGGKADAFLFMAITLSKLINKDLANNIIPIWHDESAINWYFEFFEEPKILNPSYAYPENWVLPFEPKIIQLDKSSLGGHNYLRS